MEIEKPCPSIPQTNTIKEEVAPTLSMYDYNNSAKAILGSNGPTVCNFIECIITTATQNHSIKLVVSTPLAAITVTVGKFTFIRTYIQQDVHGHTLTIQWINMYTSGLKSNR